MTLAIAPNTLRSTLRVASKGVSEVKAMSADELRDALRQRRTCGPREREEAQRAARRARSEHSAQRLRSLGD